MDQFFFLELWHGFSIILLFLFSIIFAKFVNDWLSPYKLDEQLTTKDNIALSVSLCGYFAAIAIVFLGAMLGPSQGIVKDILSIGGYTLLGVFLLNMSRFINDKFILYKFSNVKEIIEDRNAGTGAVQFGSYIASGLVIAGALHGEGGGLLTALVFFLLGQLALICFCWLYNRITPFDVHDEVEKDNVAAGVAFGGAMIALGIILMKGLLGDFIGWFQNIQAFLFNVILVFIYLPIVRLFFDKIIIPKADLNKEIKDDRNLGAAFLEASVMIAFSLVLFFAMS
jgi:uncharacterized membrane protein YjfL (UPF0719 family)